MCNGQHYARSSAGENTNADSALHGDDEDLTNLNLHMIDWAEKEGFRLFPLIPLHKQPILKGSFHNNHSYDDMRMASQDGNKYNYRACNIGIACGTYSQNKDGCLLVFDVEKPNEITNLLGSNITPTVRTPGQGLHFYYRVSEAYGEELFRSLRVKGKQEVRWTGQYVLLPSSYIY